MHVTASRFLLLLDVASVAGFGCSAARLGVGPSTDGLCRLSGQAYSEVEHLHPAFERLAPGCCPPRLCLRTAPIPPRTSQPGSHSRQPQRRQPRPQRSSRFHRCASLDSPPLTIPTHPSLGRRVLESYYLLFVHDAADSNAVYDYDVLVSRALNACLLGEHVAPRWSLGHVLRWAPAMPKANIRAVQEKKPDSELAEALATDLGIIRTVGLYKVMGEAVQAVVGGVYHQFVRPSSPAFSNLTHDPFQGGSVAHRLFHTRILPYVLHSDRGSAVPPELHAGAMKICETMGGMAAYDTNGSVN